MEQFKEIWPLMLALVGLVPFFRVYTAHMSHRSRHRESQLEALQKLLEIDVSDMSTEQALFFDATLSYVYTNDMSLKMYKVLRSGSEPPTAMKHFRYVRPFLELSDSSDRLRYKRRRFMFDKKSKEIPAWRVSVVYGAIYVVAGSLGLTLLALGMAAISVASWVWAITFLPIGFALLAVGIVFLAVGEQFQAHIEPFKGAAGVILGV